MGLEAEKLLPAARAAIEAVNATAIIEDQIFRGEVTVTVDKRWIVPIVRALKEHGELKFDMLSDITAIDYLHTDREPRFDVLYQLYSIELHHRMRLKAPVEEEDCRIDSICAIWSGTSFMEREILDLMGIEFTGHPDPRRILMPDNWKGHPLRKDHPLGGSKSFYYKHETSEYAGEPDDLVPRIRIQEGDI